MGALTLKHFPFILRDWDIQSYDSIDPTDSFGQDTKIYINKNKIIKIEPQFSNTTSNTWLTDKGRQFFDSIPQGSSENYLKKKATSTQSLDKKYYDSTVEEASLKNKTTATSPLKSEKQWETLFKIITKTLYIFDICNFKKSNKHFFIIVFEDISLETLNLLFLLSQTYSFIKIRRTENLDFNTNLESNFQINSGTHVSKLSSSSLCLLLATNTRYEGSYLNLKLRQRYLKGNFKLLSIGSYTNLTFPIFSLGSNISILKTLTEGTHTSCIDLINSNNPTIITNTEILKRKDIQSIAHVIKMLKHTNIISKVWNGFNIINSSLHETGINSQTTFPFLTLKDLICFSSFYIINVNINNIGNFKKITESKLLKLQNLKKISDKKLVIHQDHLFLSKNSSKFINFKKYLYLPSNSFFENHETFINTEGLIKRTNKLIFRKKTKSSWQLLRKFTKNIKLLTPLNNMKDMKIIFFNNKNVSDFKNFIGFQFYAIQTLTNLNYYFTTKNKPFVVTKKENNTFKKRSVKLISSKLKYWLDDFYTGGKDRFCQNSLIMVHCSINYKSNTTNFF